MKNLLNEKQKPQRMTKDEVLRNINHITKCLKQSPHNIVLLDPNPLNQGIGAGHSRQIYMMRLFLEECKVSNLITYISLSEMKVSGLLTKMSFRLYKYLQNNPKLYDVVNYFLNLFGNNSVIDRELMKTDFTDEVMRSLKKSSHFNSKRPTIFITTYVAETITAVRIINRKILKGKVLEFIPDPFPLVQLQMMSSPITAVSHATIVHDRQTIENLKIIGRNKAEKRQIYPLGTLSNFAFMMNDSKNKSINSPIHIGIEFGGNYLPHYDRKVFDFVRSIADKIKTGEVNVTVHTMYHRHTYKNLISLLHELRINHGSDRNIRIISHNGIENSVYRTLVTRESYITGKSGDGWEAPHVVISKGGEVTIEDRNNMLIIAVYGAGHERWDVEVGVKEKRSVNFIDVPVENLYKEILKILKRSRGDNQSPPQSFAVFGILALLDTSYFKKFILSKINNL